MGKEQEVKGETSARPVVLSAAEEKGCATEERNSQPGLTKLAAVKVNSYVFKCALLDTCSTVAIITRLGVELVEEYEKKKLPFEPATCEVKGVNGQLSAIVGYVTADLTVANGVLRAQRLAVVEDIVNQHVLLIGTPQIEALGGTYNIDTHEWRVRAGGRVPVWVRRLGYTPTERLVPVVLTEDVLLEPRTGNMVRAHLGAGNLAGLQDVLMVEPTSKKQALPEFIVLAPGPRRMDRHHRGAMTLELFNCGYGRHRIKKGTVVGWASEVEVVTAVALDSTPLLAGSEEKKLEEAAKRLDAAIEKAVNENGDLSTRQKERLKELLLKHEGVHGQAAGARRREAATAQN